MNMKSGSDSLLVLIITPGILIVIGITIWLMKSYIKNKSDDSVENRKALISTLLFVIGGVPLLIYPFVLVFNVMSLMLEMNAQPYSLLFRVIHYVYMVVSYSYPLTYLLSLIYYKRRRKILISLAPIIHITAAVLLFLLWIVVDK